MTAKKNHSVTVDEVDQLLPQTQCGLCEYSGCRPYAQAIVYQNVAINRCPPGGVKTLMQLAELLDRDPAPLISEMQQKAKPPSVAVIREEECIGCTKCILACPVDAILGAAKLMHTVITDQCTGCELCIAPCPVDCIDMVSVPEQKLEADVARTRFNERNVRLQREKMEKAVQHRAAKLVKTNSDVLRARKNAIQEAVLRTKNKRAKP